MSRSATAALGVRPDLFLTPLRHYSTMTFEKTTLIGTSPESFEAAVDDAIDRSDGTEESLKWAEVENFGVELATVETREYQAEVTLAFEL